MANNTPPSVQIRSVHHVGLVTSQFERLRRFYIETLGLSEVGGFPEHKIAFIAVGTTRIELLGSDRLPGERKQIGWRHLTLEVDDVDAAFAALLEAGVEASSPPESFPPEVPAFRIAFLRDPDGNLLELIQQIGGQSH